MYDLELWKTALWSKYSNSPVTSLISGQLRACFSERQLELLGALQCLQFPEDLVGDNQSLLLLHRVIYFIPFTRQFIIYLCDSCYLLCCSFHVAKNERFYGTLGFHASDGATLILFLRDTVGDLAGQSIAGYWYRHYEPPLRLIRFLSHFNMWDCALPIKNDIWATVQSPL